MNPAGSARPTSFDDQPRRSDAPPPEPGVAAPNRRRPDGETEADITRAFSTSMVVSGVRCLLAYVILPWVLPILGVAGGVGPAVGLVVGVVAIVFNVASIRRFMRSGHRYRYWIATINVVVIGMLSVLVVRDVVDLAG